MQHRALGHTGLSVSLAGLGTGGPSQFGQSGQLSFAEQDALLHRALDLGITIFDTAMAYGDSEELLGRALADVPRDRYVLTTKLTPTRVPRATYTTTPPGDTAADLIAPDDVADLCRASLRRLGVDAIDVYQVHGVTPDLYPAVVDRLYPALVRLREQGLIHCIGITERFFQDPAHAMLAQAVPSGLWDTVMLKYGLLNQAAANTILPLCVRHGVGVLNMAPVRVKLTRPDELAALLADWRARGLLAPDALPADDSLGWLVHGGVTSVIDAGYRFAAEPAAISTVLTGTARIAHLESNVASLLAAPLPAADAARLRAVFGHLTEGA
ncbi:MAG: aldo/keto reductase [Chloroflexi bacterium]|nr:aldo/keto reductase [Chloroflexota bacterium]